MLRAGEMLEVGVEVGRCQIETYDLRIRKKLDFSHRHYQKCRHSKDLFGVCRLISK